MSENIIITRFKIEKERKKDVHNNNNRRTLTFSFFLLFPPFSSHFLIEKNTRHFYYYSLNAERDRDREKKHHHHVMRNAAALLNNNVFCSYVTSSSSSSKDDINNSKKKSSVKSFQSLTFREKHSNTKVCLIGTMHYNPRSIELVSEMTSKAIEDGSFGCLVLESCEKRWEKTLEFQRPGTIRRQLLDNEFQAAQELVEDQAQVSLGDQSIDDLGQNMKRIFKETLEDVKSIDGWKRVREDLVRYSATELYPTKEFGKDVQTLSLQDFLLDGRLLVALPISLFRYPLAWLLKSPKLVVPLLSFYFGLANLPGLVEAMETSGGGDVLATAASGGVDLVQSADILDETLSVLFLFLDVFQIVVLSRLMLVALLGERNDVLSESIRQKCEEQKGTEKTVIAILGAAHLNGVQNRLL